MRAPAAFVDHFLDAHRIGFHALAQLAHAFYNFLMGEFGLRFAEGDEQCGGDAVAGDRDLLAVRDAVEWIV